MSRPKAAAVRRATPSGSSAVPAEPLRRSANRRLLDGEVLQRATRNWAAATVFRPRVHQAAWSYGNELQRESQGENRAEVVGSTLTGCAVNSPIRGLQQRSLLRSSIGASEVVQCAQCPARGDLDHRPKTIGPAVPGCAVEVAIRRLEQTRHSETAVGPAEAMECGKCSAGSDFEDGATADRRTVIASAALGRSIEIRVAGLHQRSRGGAAIVAIEAI